MAEEKKPQLKSVPTKSSGEGGSGKPGDGKTEGKTNGSQAKSNGASRPAVVSLNYPDKKALQKAYMTFLKGGGLFLPTHQKYELKEEIFLLVTLPETGKAIPVPGTVVWKTPAGAQDARRQGVGIEFKGREGNALRNRIEGMLGAKIGSSTPTFTM